MIRSLLYRLRHHSGTARGLTRSGVTTMHLILVAWCAFRVAALGKAIADSPTVVGTSALPTAVWILLGAVLLESCVLLAALVRSRGLPPRSLVLVDVALSAVVALSPIAQGVSDSAPQLPWHFALVFTTVCLIAFRFASTFWTVSLVLGLSSVYLVGRHWHSDWSSPAVTVASSFTVLMVFAVGAAFSGHLVDLARRMEALSETNAKLAARAAVANERATQRVFLHDTAGLLAMIANTTDPDLGAVLRDRARATSKELRAYVYSERQTEAGPSRSLHEILERIAGEFRDLPIEQNTLLAKNVFLTGDTIQAVESAMRTLLDNIRVHANAHTVIIHARSTGAGWELTVRDDGVGFDLERTKKGFGLRDQVESQCALVGVSVRISSRPGEGTEVRLNGTSSPLGPKPVRAARPTRHRVSVMQQWRAVRGQAATRR